MTDPRDPLAGLDPYPRELIEAIGLHPERADLLEDIVSTPSPASPTSTRTRALLAIGVAAAIAIIGGAWVLAGGGGGHDDTPVAAASSTPTTSTASAPPSSTATDSTTAPSAPSTMTDKQRCRGFLTRRTRTRAAQLNTTLGDLSQAIQGKRGKHQRFYLRATKNGREYVVDARGCRIATLTGRPGRG